MSYEYDFEIINYQKLEREMKHDTMEMKWNVRRQIMTKRALWIKKTQIVQYLTNFEWANISVFGILQVTYIKFNKTTWMR